MQSREKLVVEQKKVGGEKEVRGGGERHRQTDCHPFGRAAPGGSNELQESWGDLEF